MGLDSIGVAANTIPSGRVGRDTGRPKGFGFVEMGSDQEARAAIAARNGKEVDGRPSGLPRRLLARGVFPAGYRLDYLMANVELELPGPAVYRLDIAADEGLGGGVCHYAIEIREQRPA